jgi:hypothetical protein
VSYKIHQAPSADLPACRRIRLFSFQRCRVLGETEEETRACLHDGETERQETARQTDKRQRRSSVIRPPDPSQNDANRRLRVQRSWRRAPRKDARAHAQFSVRLRRRQYTARERTVMASDLRKPSQSARLRRQLKAIGHPVADLFESLV